MSDQTLFVSDQQVQEEWRPVVGREAFYSVSSLGRVRREFDAPTQCGRLLAGTKNKRGYWRVYFTKPANRCEFVHRVVAAAFLPPSDGMMEVNHINGDRGDTRLCNLEYATPGENQRHSYRVGLRKPVCLVGENNPVTKLPDLHVRAICILRAGGMLCDEVASLFGVSASHVAGISRNTKRQAVDPYRAPVLLKARRRNTLSAEQVEQLIPKLSERDQRVVRLLYGSVYMTRNEISRQVGLTLSQIAHVEGKLNSLIGAA